MLESLSQYPAAQATSVARHAYPAAINRQHVYLPAELGRRVTERLQTMRAQRWVSRLWAGDAKLWTDTDENHWTGWVDPSRQEPVIRRYLGQCARLRDNGCVNAILMGMGGAALGAHVLQNALGSAAGGLRLHVLDSTDPDQVAALQRRVAPETCLHIVASKSGTTMESTLLAQHFYESARDRIGANAGRHFCAITDPGSPLQALAEQQGYAAIFTGDRTVGGRYSVLSPFGLVPLVLMGHDPIDFLRHAKLLRNHCGPRVPLNNNPAALLGATLGEAALAHRDKVTIWAEPELEGFGEWIEQLLAESTGKFGGGLIPVNQEPIAQADRYSSDRLFVILRHGATMERQRDALRAAGQAVIDVEIGDGAALAQEFYRWQFATAVAGSILQVNPFDQPDVEASKSRTRQLLGAPVTPADGQRYGSLIVDTGSNQDLGEWLQTQAARYFALLAYVPCNSRNRAWLSYWQGHLRDLFGTAVTAGFGPRYLHASGQLHKGGPAGGAYLFIGRQTCEANELGRCQTAQAQADLAELRARGRRCAAAWFTADAVQGMRDLGALLEQALSVTSASAADAALT